MLLFNVFHFIKIFKIILFKIIGVCAEGIFTGVFFTKICLYITKHSNSQIPNNNDVVKIQTDINYCKENIINNNSDFNKNIDEKYENGKIISFLVNLDKNLT